MSRTITMRPRVELTWVGSGRWHACDTAMTGGDPRRVVALLTCSHQHVEVCWMLRPRAPQTFDTLREAFQAVSEDCARPEA